MRAVSKRVGQASLMPCVSPAVSRGEEVLLAEPYLDPLTELVPFCLQLPACQDRPLIVLSLLLLLLQLGPVGSQLLLKTARRPKST